MDQTGWTYDRRLLRPVATDPQLLEARLEVADPIERLFLLPLIDRLGEAFVESERLLADPMLSSDPWPVLLATAEVYRWDHQLDETMKFLTQAWKWALSRSRQATTIEHFGYRWDQYGDRDRACSCYQLALTMQRGFADAESMARVERALADQRADLKYDAIILAGGRGLRLGGGRGVDKPAIPLAGWPLVDHVLLAAAGASRRIVAGRRRMALADPTFCLEDPPGGGPVAGIAAALSSVESGMVAVLAADLPFVGRALDSLRTCITLGGRDAGALVDPTGRINYLASVWRTSALRAAIDRVGDPANAPVRALFDGVDATFVPDWDADGADCDTPDDLKVADERIRRRSPGQLPAALLAWPRLELHSPS